MTARTRVDFRGPVPLRGIYRAVVVDAAWEDVWCALVGVVALFRLDGVHNGWSVNMYMYVLLFAVCRMVHESGR